MIEAQRQLTDAQEQMITDLDDVAEHVAYEFDPDEYRGISTIGFAHIKVDGRCSFVQRVKSLAESNHGMVRQNRRGYHIDVGGLGLMLSDGTDGYRLSVSNVSEIMGGPEHQRMDVRERLHDLVLERLRSHGYLENARRYSRMD